MKYNQSKKTFKSGVKIAMTLPVKPQKYPISKKICFFVKKNKLCTPLPDCFLNGITRQTVIEIAKKLKIEVEEKHYNFDFLEGCEEVFLTGTAVEITPVTSIDNFDFKVGKITR